MSILNKFANWGNSKIPYCAMIIPAAGNSQRMHGKDKLFEKICGVSVIKRTLCAIDQSQYVSEIVIPTRSELLEEISSVCSEAGIRKPVKIIVGGNTRQQSVLAGIMECSSKAEIIAVHDAARPLIKPEDVDKLILQCTKTNAVVPVIPVSDTVKIVNDNVVESTPDRSTLYSAQTPQVFQTDILKAALTSAVKSQQEFTDDSSAVEHLGKKVFIAEGNKENIKITTPIDFIIAEAILKNREES